LHDAIAQRLFSLSMSTTTLPEIIAHDQARGIQQANAIAELAEQTLLDLRALLVDLRPSSVAEHGLYDAIKSLCSQQQVECSVILSGSRIPTVIEDAIYRIAQEALNNAVKHAHAGVIELSLVEGQRQIILSVTDDGKGFDPAVAGSNGKFGLISMRERAASVGGKLIIEGERGTTVQATLPLYREGST
jgi:signal transduction histidine kinase